MGNNKVSLIEIFDLVKDEYKKIYEQYSLDTHLEWVVTKWDIYVDEYPRKDETLKIDSYLYKINRAYEKRLFVIRSENRCCVFLNSVWSTIDIKTDKIVKNVNYGISEDKIDISIPFDLNENSEYEKINDTKGSLSVITKKQIDLNNHLNNIEYIKSIYNDMNKEVFNRIRRFLIKYKKQAYINEEIELLSSRNKNVINYNFINEDREIIALAKIIID